MNFHSLLSYNFFNNGRNLNDFLNSFGHRNKFFDDSVNWNRDFDWDNDLSLDIDDLGDFNDVVDNLLNWNVSGNFLDHLDHVFSDSLSVDDSLFNGLEFNYLIDYLLNKSIYFDVDILLNNDFLNSVLNDWYLNNSLDFLDSFFNHYLWHHSLYNLRNLDYFFNNSWYHNNFFYNLLNLNNFRNFNHLFNDFLYRNLDFLDAVDMTKNLDDLFFNVLDRLRNFNVVVDDFLNFDGLGFTHNQRVANFNDNRDLSLDSLNQRFFNNFSDLENSLMSDWNLYNSLNFLRDFLDHLNNLLFNSNDFFDNLARNYLFNDSFNSVGLVDN